MCGRYVSTLSPADLATLFEAVDDSGGEARPGYNLAPTQPVPVVRVSRSQEGRVVTAARWGLVPPWSKDPGIGTRMINARSETVATSRAYRSPFARKRCLVPADGWYEWRKLPGGGKQPYYMTAPQSAPLVFAGLWEHWGKGEESLMTCTILTTDAIGELDRVHDRMPLLLTPDRYAGWLGEEGDLAPGELLAPPDTELVSSLEVRPIGRAVGNVRNDGPQLLEAVPDPEAPASGDATLF
ncbi:MAG: SOS response-associated peptidase [Stackebrandtia sp.]